MPSLTSLAQELPAQAKVVADLLEKNGLSPPSFDNDTLELLPEDAQRPRWDLLATSHNFRQLATGAKLSGLGIAFGSLFTVLAEEPERARRFDSAMKHCVDDKDFSFPDASRAFD
ncbi:hypothetical protein ACRE_086900 [Hapsidospora chrysogenum ATCC 11550]|uniref:Uncharacterized protein n=1 Tax=Hapsidospora chrysogenum (strain ATCC 11550 / CBS 779.69 / DSM 880 / IAM 14645 / JCM 23072 / IMI 49137) TaxID=857340 RepID=A0A086SU33_HAPC1|nr:hypothetical protein ACRE_086900 [Hapsidospora chrysogenum ATCC 11550]